jgi:copper chaperone CopZ
MKKTIPGVLILQLFLSVNSFAQLLTVDLTIFGMDCAICAHGVRTGLKKIDGVETVDVSLEQGLARVQLKPTNKVTLQKIQTVVKKNGFSPKSAKVQLRGTIQHRENRLQVTVSGSAEIIPAAIPQGATVSDENEHLIEGNLKIEDKQGLLLSIASVR